MAQVDIVIKSKKRSGPGRYIDKEGSGPGRYNDKFKEGHWPRQIQ